MVIKQVIQFVLNGRGHRLVIPSKLHSVVLADLHIAHEPCGNGKDKKLGVILFLVAITNCNACRQYQAKPLKADLSPWPWPSGHNRWLHADFWGP
ncbi:hypothetical protein PR048_006659, partial [Dryococelus australis]